MQSLFCLRPPLLQWQNPQNWLLLNPIHNLVALCRWGVPFVWTYKKLFPKLEKAAQIQEFQLTQTLHVRNDQRKQKQPILKTRRTNSSSKSQRSIGAQCYCKKLQISSGYTQIFIWKIWTCSGKSELYSEKSGTFWNCNPPSLLHDMTAEKTDFVFGFETLMTPKWVYADHLKSIAPIGYEPGLTNARYSYINPCCFATASIATGHTLYKHKTSTTKWGTILLFKKFRADGYPHILIFKRWWSFKPVRGRVLSEPGLDLAPPRMDLLFW